MTDWAIIRTGGKQYKVSAGETLVVEKIVDQKSENITFDEVLAAKVGDKTHIGTPLVDKAKVTAKALQNFRAKKVYVVKFKSKSRYRKHQGHRQSQLRVQIEKIALAS